MEKQFIAVTLTCFNRKIKTAVCLNSLFRAAERIADRSRLRVIVTDDNSSDGTREMLCNDFPDVEVLAGDGNLFWNGGMHLAYDRALKDNHDFYIWLNDDTELFEDSLEKLLSTHDSLRATHGRGGIVVGSTCNDNSELSYGGYRRKRSGKGLQLSRVYPSSAPIECEAFNGNCVLISAYAASELGNLESAFKHAMGDLDYGLRAKMLSIPIWIAPGYVGYCRHDHDIRGSYLDHSIPLKERWEKAMSPKGLPARDWRMFCRRHAGKWWLFYWGKPYVKIVLTSLAKQFRFSDSAT